MRKIFIFIALTAALAGCSMPVTTVRSVENRPSIAIEGAPDDAIVLVDGVPAGTAGSYNGQPDVLIVEPGTHRVVVQQGGTVLFDCQVFVDSEMKRINVR